jgi:hypothetical protein
LGVRAGCLKEQPAARHLVLYLLRPNRRGRPPSPTPHQEQRSAGEEHARPFVR